jgi:protease-4
MGSLAASGGYYVAASSRWIVANELTITGSIGVVMHGYNYRGLMNKIGLRPLVYKSGRFKDMLSGEKDLEQMTAEEKADFEEEEKMVRGLIDQTFNRFKQVVEEGRRQANQLNQNNKDTPGKSLSSTWVDYADGRVISGRQAFELGFVDEVGTWEAAVKRARQLAGITDANLVTYQQMFDLFSLFSLFGKTDAARVKVDWGVELPRLEPGHLYFLSPTYLR